MDLDLQSAFESEKFIFSAEVVTEKRLPMWVADRLKRFTTRAIVLQINVTDTTTSYRKSANRMAFYGCSFAA